MTELVSLIYKLPNNLHRAVTNLTFAEATTDLLENLRIDDPKAEFAVGILQTDDVSMAVEIARGSSEELSQILALNVTRLRDNLTYWKSV